MTLVLRGARRGDFQDLYNFLFVPPHENIRRRTPEEVQEMVDQGLFFIVREYPSGRLVAACYLADPDEDESTWELGGAFVADDHRGRRLSYWLGKAALVQYVAFMKTDQPVIGHVLTSNEAIRGILERLGFSLATEDETFDPLRYRGLEHMRVEEDGLVHADIFEFRDDQIPALLRNALDFDGVFGTGNRSVPGSIEVDAFEDRFLLEQLLAAYEDA